MIEAIGGLGLFLLGMSIMTEGLRSLTGHKLRQALIHFTRSPASGALTGAIATAILQSSSATTVAAVGFVSAGLLSFSSALGIIFGANIGTTITGWLVVLFGFKLQLGVLVLPLILAGALLRLFGSKSLSTLGYAIAGFGLIFVGISYLQTGMADLQVYFNPVYFSDSTVSNQLILVLSGALFTVITQSSSAGVATTLTALYAGNIEFEHAAALVIGMDFGTTFTAAIATIGGSIESRRTGYSHVIYNLFTAVGALLLITPFISLWNMWVGTPITDNAEVALVTFHSLFNLLGVIAILPFTRHFARLIKYLFTDKGSSYTGALDSSLLKDPAVALAAIQVTTQNIFTDLLHHLNALLGEAPPDRHIRLSALRQAIDESLEYIYALQLGEEKSAERLLFISTTHALDHLQRLTRRCHELDSVNAIRQYAELEDDRQALVSHNTNIIRAMQEQDWDKVIHIAKASEMRIDVEVLPLRKRVVARVVSGKLDVSQANDQLEAIRWLDRVTDHIDRISLHLAPGDMAVRPSE